MITLYNATNRGLNRSLLNSLPLTENCLWLDLFHPTEEELAQIKSLLDIYIPTEDEIKMGITTMLYGNEEAIYLTAMVINDANNINSNNQPLIFILYTNYLITVRYNDFTFFDTFSAHITKYAHKDSLNSLIILMSIFDDVVDQIAEELEIIRKDIDLVAQQVFQGAMTKKTGRTKQNYQELLHQIGKKGRLISKSRESLVNLVQIISYLSESTELELSKNTCNGLNNLLRNTQSLSGYADYLSNEVTFLLDATLGMINIEQNNVVKILSVTTTILLPPTFIATLYGMNFKYMPELSMHYGYPLCLLTMLLTSMIPYRYFKWRKWL